MRGFGRISALVAAALVLLFGGQAFGQAQPAANAQTFTLRPGGTATVTFEAFCTDFGLKFPANVQVPNAQAPDTVRAALAYARTQNLTGDPAQAEQVQRAIWQLNGATEAGATGQTAQNVINGATTPPVNPQGTSLVDAAKSGQVRVTISNWKPLGNKVQIGQLNDYFYGTGTLTVQNTTQQDLTLFMPFGAAFPPAEQGSQTMAGYATNLQIQNPATATPVATAVPAATPVSNQPPRLPQTSGLPGQPSLLLLAGALALCAAGVAVLRRHG
ncbi:MAG TPA: hypothetical protein VFS21_19475 [Roseiflexaceae bacterium]|nr:hypothetical protein [Roseiflexaceae bacterium]